MTTEKTSAERGKATVWRLVAQLLNGGLPNLIDELYSPELASRAPRMDRAFPGLRLPVSQEPTAPGSFIAEET